MADLQSYRYRGSKTGISQEGPKVDIIRSENIEVLMTLDFWMSLFAGIIFGYLLGRIVAKFMF